MKILSLLKQENFLWAYWASIGLNFANCFFDVSKLKELPFGWGHNHDYDYDYDYDYFNFNFD